MIEVDPRICLHCAQCVGTCPYMALELNDMHIEVSDKCKKCLWCVISCPVGALTMAEG